MIFNIKGKFFRTPEDFKAWSQNLGHEKVLTTFYSYGEVGNRRQGEIIKGLATPQQTTSQDVKELAKGLDHEFANQTRFPIDRE